MKLSLINTYNDMISKYTVSQSDVNKVMYERNLSVALLNNPRVNCQCHIVSCPGHMYFVQTIDGKQYGVDNTWGITRNPNKMGEALKAREFSYEYLLIGNDKLNESENTRRYHTSRGYHKFEIEDCGISRDRIQQSVEKLKSLGVEFSYDEPPVLRQYLEQDIER